MLVKYIRGVVYLIKCEKSFKVIIFDVCGYCYIFFEVNKIWDDGVKLLILY